MLSLLSKKFKEVTWSWTHSIRW